MLIYFPKLGKCPEFYSTVDSTLFKQTLLEPSAVKPESHVLSILMTFLSEFVSFPPSLPASFVQFSSAKA